MVNIAKLENIGCLPLTQFASTGLSGVGRNSLFLCVLIDNSFPENSDLVSIIGNKLS